MHQWGRFLAGESPPKDMPYGKLQKQGIALWCRNFISRACLEPAQLEDATNPYSHRAHALIRIHLHITTCLYRSVLVRRLLGGEEIEALLKHHSLLRVLVVWGEPSCDDQKRGQRRRTNTYLMTFRQAPAMTAVQAPATAAVSTVLYVW